MFLGRVLDETPAVVFLVDDQLVIRWANRTTEAVFGYPVDEVVGSSVLDFVDASSNPDAVESVVTAMGGRGPRLPMVFRANARDGSILTVEVTANVQLHDPVLGGLVVHLRPWDERHLLDRTLDAMAAGAPADTALRLLVDVLGSETVGAPAALVSDLRQGRAAGIVAAPGLLADLSGPGPGCSDAVASAWSSLLDRSDGAVHDVADLPPILRDPARAEGFQTLWVWPADPGHQRLASAWAVAWRSEPHLDRDEGRRTMMARVANLGGLILHRARQDEALARAAAHDALTGLPNRASLYDALDAQLGRLAEPAPAQVGVIYLDLDGFKPVNDRNGHGAGDRILAAIGSRLGAGAPPDALMARLGGDEFALVMATTGLEAMVDLAHRLVDVVGAPVELRAGEEVTVGVSAGVAVTADPACSADALIDAADRALYAAKRAGGGVKASD